ncbi:unnamed protein product [Aureobasidium vineae]|uniref:Heme-dependent catalase n=1 Tax=Aureobasidium vineae TaxID=2773715 RepID=A0A9N8JUX9_9PEZI|nr:unnamed protein product [Aureobasidium vineae]
MTEALKETVSSAWTNVKRGLSSAPPNDAYLAWDAEGVEIIKPDEQEKTQRIKEVMERMQEHNFDLHRKAFRATHVKTQGIVKGTLRVHSDLPEHLRQGIFAEPGKTYDVAARYANEPYLLQRDQENGPRGLGLKVFDVTGPRLEGVDDSVNTQDFFFNNAPSIELTDIDTTLEIMSLREKYFDDPAALGTHLKMRTDLVKQHAPYMLPNTNIISHAMYSQSAFRFGKYYGHMALFPVLESQKAADAKVKNDDPSCVLSDWLFDYFGGKEAKYEFKIQLGTDPAHHPTEDGSVVWDEATSPYQSLGTITFPTQNSFSQERRVFWEDHMSLDAWTGLDAHRPLGGINRLRKDVYPHSKKTRDKINVSKSEDVRSVDEIPN